MEAGQTFKRNSRQFNLGSKEVTNEKRSSFLGLLGQGQKTSNEVLGNSYGGIS